MRTGIALVFGFAAFAAIAGTVMQAVFWPHAKAPSWLNYTHEGIGNTGTGIGSILGFVLALWGVAWRNRRQGIRSLMKYPPVMQLWQIGWRIPGD
jgi:hypothetical protein